MKKLLLIAVIILSVSSKAQYLDFATTMDGTSSHVDGPNCWNGALVAAGVLKSKRFIRPEEWTGHLQKNCFEIERPIPGSVGRIFHLENNIETEVHGFIHLDSDTIFAKHGENAQHGYMIMSYEEMLDQYGKTRSCRINNDNSPECFHHMKYYSCKGESEFNPRLKTVANLLDELVFSEETKWFYKVTCEDNVFLKREELFLKMASELELLLNEITSDQQLLERFLSNGVHESVLESINHQIYNLEVSLRSFKCKDRKARNRAAKAARNATKSLRKLFE